MRGEGKVRSVSGETMIKEGNVGKRGGGKEEWNGERETKKMKHNGGQIDETKKAGKKMRGR